MKYLLAMALKNRRHLILLIGTVFSMLFLTVASQMEIGALGVMASKGPDFFELFAPIKEGTLEKGDFVHHSDLETRWNEIDADGKGYISKTDSVHYLAQWKRYNIVERVVAFLDSHFGTSQSVSRLALLLIAVALFKAISMFFFRFCTRMVAIRVSKELRMQYFEHIQSLPMDFYHKHRIGSISSRVVTDALSIAEAINSSLINYLQMPFTVLTTLSLCFLTSWRLSLIIFCGFPLIVFPIIYLARKVKKVVKQLQKNQEHFASVLIDYLSGIQTVKIFAMEDFSLKKYREYNERMAALERRGARYDLASRPIIHTIAMMFLATTLLYGLYGLNMGLPELFLFCGLLYIFYEPIKKFAEENNNIQRGIAAAERMVEVMQLKPHIEDAPNAKALDTLRDHIAFDDVWFRYDDEWILKGVSFKVKKGETVAIVGPTGAGKSTIVQLLPRLYDVQKGAILIDGQPLASYTQRSLRESIAFVPQKPFLFLDTVSENIAYGRNFSQEQVRGAARRAYAEEFIVQLPQGFDTFLEEAGKNLSGGQQQRLAIARALVKEAPILVLDEATSALDNVSEQKIKEAIKDLKGSVTQIIIAHRLSTIEDADRIIYMERGTIVAQGTKDQLLETCDGFRAMWKMK
jgi:ABC-type multidrug transport system fused ATPase/permease subunit